jgi:CheY-like chemotaxis protein
VDDVNGGVIYPAGTTDDIPDDEAAPAANVQCAAPKPTRVLVADDDEAITEMMALAIEFEGYVPLVAANGRQALELARTHGPALVITDMMMPQLDGMGLITALRADAAACGTVAPPIVMMSALGPDHLLGAGPDAILAKPFRLQTLQEVLERFLGHAADDSSVACA